MTRSWTSDAASEFIAHWPMVWSAAALPALVCAGTLVIARTAFRSAEPRSCDRRGAGTRGIIDALALAALLTWMLLRLRIVPDFEVWTFPPRHSIVALTVCLLVAGVWSAIAGAADRRADGTDSPRHRRTRAITLGFTMATLALLAQPSDWSVQQKTFARAGLVVAGLLVWWMLARVHRREPGMALIAASLTWAALAGWADFIGPAPSMSIMATGMCLFLAALVPFGRCGGIITMSEGARLLIAATLVALAWTTWFGARPGHPTPPLSLTPLAAPLATLLLLQNARGVLGATSARGVACRVLAVTIAAAAAVVLPALQR